MDLLGRPEEEFGGFCQTFSRSSPSKQSIISPNAFQNTRKAARRYRSEPTLQKYGCILFHPQPGLPRASQASKLALEPLVQQRPFRIVLPPTARPWTKGRVLLSRCCCSTVVKFHWYLWELPRPIRPGTVTSSEWSSLRNIS